MDILLKQELIRDEGLRLVAYQDSVDLWTIGVGHLLGDKPRLKEITYEEAMAFLAADIKAAEVVINDTIPQSNHWKMCGIGPCQAEAVRYRALVNMAFNLGGKRFRGFKKFIEAVNISDWGKAAEEMMDSKWAGQVKKRALRLHDMILNGEVT